MGNQARRPAGTPGGTGGQFTRDVRGATHIPTPAPHPNPTAAVNALMAGRFAPGAPGMPTHIDRTYVRNTCFGDTTPATVITCALNRFAEQVDPVTD